MREGYCSFFIKINFDLYTQREEKIRSLYSSVKLVIISGDSSELIDESECVEREVQRDGGTEREREREREGGGWRYKESKRHLSETNLMREGLQERRQARGKER